MDKLQRQELLHGLYNRLGLVLGLYHLPGLAKHINPSLTSAERQ